MNLLAAIKREERSLENQVRQLQQQLHGLRAAAQALGGLSLGGHNGTGKRVLSAAARAKISRAAKRRWAKVRAGVKKSVS